MKILLGLGNPGPEYVGTRHNAGMMLVERLAEKLSSDYGWRKSKGVLYYESGDWLLLKTGGIFMNESGRMIREAMDMKGREHEWWVAHDDLDIKLGEYKIQKGKGPKEHNGVISVEQALGTTDFWRVRLGIENRRGAISGEEYVLQRFAGEERNMLEAVIGEAAGDILK